jgi:hypothetical protein
MNELEYTYGGQWFDDMGSLAFSFSQDPATGIDIARAGLSRAQANDMAAALLRNSPIPDPGMPDLGV